MQGWQYKIEVVNGSMKFLGIFGSSHGPLSIDHGP